MIYELQRCDPALPCAAMCNSIAKFLAGDETFTTDMAVRFANLLAAEESCDSEFRELGREVLAYIRSHMP